MPPSERRDSTRTTPRVLLAVAAALLAARIALGVADAVNPEIRPELVNWTSPAAAGESAREKGRLVLYVFTDSKDAASRRLASDLFGDPALASRIERTFVPVRIDGPASRDTPETAALRRKFGVTELPALVVATPDGAKSRLVPGRGPTSRVVQGLTRAQMEVMDIPFQRPGSGFQFRVGRGRGAAPDSAGGAFEFEADSSVGR
jgi:hypothetical protein